MRFRTAGDVAGSARATAPALLGLTDTLDRWIEDPPLAPRGVYFDDVPGHPGYLRYRVVARDGHTLACGYIERDENDDTLRALFLCFLERRDPVPPTRLRMMR